MKYLILTILLFSLNSHANRIPEIEEHYIKKTSQLLETRFPDKPFTVFVTVDTGGEKTLRDSAKDKRRQARQEDTSLPYLGIDEEVRDIDFWSRTDLPLGSLISQLESVEIKIKIDSTITEEEMNELKLSLSEQLKLVPGTDSIIIEKMDWTAQENAKKRWWVVFGFLGALTLIFGALYLISKVSVKQLAKSLSEPISEIGKSTQAFANNALNMATDQEFKTDNTSSEEDKQEEELSLGSNLLELRNSGLELLERNIDLLKTPDVEVMAFLENHGEANPRAMGAILAELDEKILRSIFSYGMGAWWFVALSQPSSMNPASLKILNELDRLRLRRNFDINNEKIENTEIRGAGLIFGRLSVEQLVEVFKGTKIEAADSVLSILPKAFSLAVGKALFPGQWASFLDESRKIRPIDMTLLSKLKESALEICPLRKKTEIQSFFRDLDISKYLDLATYHDEKDFYTALPEDSRIKKDRVPFYSIFEAEAEVIKLMASELGVKDWVYVLYNADNMQTEHFLKNMPARLSYRIREDLKDLDIEQVENNKVRTAKKKALQSYLHNKQIADWKSKTAQAATEEATDENSNNEEAA